MRRPLIAIGILALALLGTFGWMNWQGGSDLGPAEDDSLALEGESPEILESPPKPSEPNAEPDEGASGERRSAEQTEEPTTLIAWQTHDPVGLLIRVVQGPKGRPAAGAQVSILTTERQQDPSVAVDLRHGGGVHATLDAFGTHYVTDKRGEVRAPLGTGASIVRAQKTREGADWTAMLLVNEVDAPPFVLTLEPASQFRVQVLQANGLPARGAQPQLLAAIQFDDKPPKTSWLVHKGTANRAGWAVLENTVDQISKGLPEHLNESLIAFVGVYGIFKEDLRWGVSWRDTTPATIEAQLPPTGSVQIAALDSAGKALTEGWVVLRSQAHSPGGNRWERTEQMLRQELHKARGMARFDWIEVGQDLVAEYYRSPNHATQRMEVRGPQAEGETVSVSFETGEERESFHGTLVDADGNPIAKQTVGVSEATHGARLGHARPRQSFQTDAQGRFTFDAAWVSKVGDSGRSIFFRLDRPGQVRWTGEVQPAVVPPDEPTDLGIIPLSVPPLIVAGQVLAPNRAPLPCSMIVTQPESEPAPNGAIAKRERWRVRTDASGYFAVHAQGSHQPVSLELVTEGYQLLDEEPVPAGSSQVVLSTIYNSSLTFRMSGTSKELSNELVARLTQVDDFPERNILSGYWDRFGVVYFQKLQPGPYLLEIVQQDVPEVVLWFDGVTLPAGRPHDLGEIPLDVQLNTYSIEFQVPANRSVSEFKIAHAIADGVKVPARIQGTGPGHYAIRSIYPLDQVEIIAPEQAYYRRRFDIQVGQNRLQLP